MTGFAAGVSQMPQRNVAVWRRVSLARWWFGQVRDVGQDIKKTHRFLVKKHDCRFGEENRDVKIGTPREIFEGEARVAMTPASAQQLMKLGYECAIEKGAGVAAGFSDNAYKEVGVEVIGTAAAL